MLRELGVHDCMHACAVAHMHEIGLTGPYFLRKQHGLTYVLVSGMLLGMQGVDHKSLSAFKQLERLIVHALHIGDVCQVSDSETQNGQVAVHYSYGQYLQITHPEPFTRLNLTQFHMRHAGIDILVETIRHTLHDMTYHVLLGIDGNGGRCAVRTQVVQTSYMVVVLVCNNHSVKLFDAGSSSLPTEVRTAVNDDFGAVRFNQGR